RHGIHVGAGKPAMAHVERRRRDLHLLARIIGHRLGGGLPARRRIVQPEGVVEVRAVHGDVVVQPVSPREAVVAITPRIDPNQVARAALDRRQQGHLLGIDERGGTGAPRVEHLILLCRRLDRLQLDRLALKAEIDLEILPQTEEQILFGVGLVADAAGGDPIRAADSHVGDVVRPARPGDGPVRRAARYRLLPPITAMQNPDIARLFDEVADLLEIQGANPFRVRAYRNAARIVRDYPEPLAEVVRSGTHDLTEIAGIGDDLAEKIT